MLLTPSGDTTLSFDIVCGLRAGRQKGQQPVNGQIGTSARGRSATAPWRGAVGRASKLDFRLFGHLEGVIHLDAKVADGTLKFRMAEQ